MTSNWTIGQITNKVISTLAFLMRILRSCPKQSKIAYASRVRPIMKYGAIVRIIPTGWCYSSLLAIQNQEARFINGEPVIISLRWWIYGLYTAPWPLHCIDCYALCLKTESGTSVIHTCINSLRAIASQTAKSIFATQKIRPENEAKFFSPIIRTELMDRHSKRYYASSDFSHGA